MLHLISEKFINNNAKCKMDNMYYLFLEIIAQALK